MATREARAIWAQKKSRFLGPNPSNSLRNGFSRMKIIKSMSHTKKRYIGNFMYMSFRGPPFSIALPPLAVWVRGGGGISKNYSATNSVSPNVELWFCPWLILFKY